MAHGDKGKTTRALATDKSQRTTRSLRARLRTRAAKMLRTVAADGAHDADIGPSRRSIARGRAYREVEATRVERHPAVVANQGPKSERARLVDVLKSRIDYLLELGERPEHFVRAMPDELRRGIDESLARVAAGLDVRRGTVALIRAALSAGGTDPPRPGLATARTQRKAASRGAA